MIISGKPKFVARKEKKPMTLVAAFRGQDGSVLLCADREENGGTKQDVSKITHLKFPTFSVFIAGAGETSVIKNTETQIHDDLIEADCNKQDVPCDYKKIIQGSLNSIYEEYSVQFNDLHYQMGLIVLIVDYSIQKVPIIYRSERTMLVPEPYYVARGSGQFVSDYLQGRLYECPAMSRRDLISLAAFIFREAHVSSVGVGSKVDMKFIGVPKEGMLEINPDAVKSVQDGLPSLGDSLRQHWYDHSKLPDWLSSQLLES